ncbi:MAG: hypothetical protein OXC62_03860 [Aestuariivita sp.]|nr:hypothetical protein [Aestuariivita sp.]
MNAIGKLIRFVVLPSQSHDMLAVPALLNDLSCERLIGDNAFDSDALLVGLIDYEA